MARYVVHVRTPRTPAEAFAYMADLANFAEWDPGVETSRIIDGDGPGLGSVYEVVVRSGRGTMALDYVTIDYEPPRLIVARAESRRLVSLDRITVQADGKGAIVTYDADLSLKGLLRIADPLLGVVFRRIGDKAAAGLIAALDGEATTVAGS